MPQVRLPIVNDLLIKKYTAGVPVEYEEGMNNCVAMKKGGRVVATNRPPLIAIYDAGYHSLTGLGRGVYSSGIDGNTYFVNGGTCYRWDGPTHTSMGNLTANARERVYWAEIGSKLMFTDPDNNDAWTLESFTLTKITDADFPSTLAHGLAVLNGRAYVLDTDGVIYGSDIDDATSWNALNFIEAERNPDGGIFICTIMDQVVVFGEKTIEIFYDTGASVGSPLQRRADVAYQQGSYPPVQATYSQIGDMCFFVSQNGQYGYGAFLLVGTEVKKISNEHIDWYISGTIGAGYHMMGTAFSESGHTYYTLTTLYITSSTVYTPFFTIIFDLTNNIWMTWSSSMNGNANTFPLISYENKNFIGWPGYGMTLNGDIVTVAVMADKYVQDTIHDGFSTTPDAYIACQVRTGQIDANTNNRKFCSRAELVGEKTSASQAVILDYSDDNNLDYPNDQRLLDMADYASANRLGSFRRRNFKIDWSTGTEQVYLEAIEVDVTVGTS